MRINKLTTTILLASAAFLMTAVNVAQAHGGGSTHYVKHHQHVHTTYHEQYRLSPKKHYHPATAYVPATYHAHGFSLPFHRHYYWKTPSYVYNTHHH